MQDAPTPVRDFISVDDAITLIEGHQKNAPTILPSKLRLTYLYCKPGNNITLFQSKLGTMTNGKIGAVPTAPVYVQIKTLLEAETLKKTIKDKIQELTAKEFNPDKPVYRSTANEEGNERCIMKNNLEPQTQLGQEIRS